MTTAHVGMTIGDRASVAIHRARTSDAPVVTALATTLRFDADGTAHLGDDNAPDAITDFVSAVGESDATGPYRPEDLVATAAACLRALVSAVHDGAVSATITYPERWSSATVGLLRDALDHVGQTDLEMVPDAVAVAAFLDGGGDRTQPNAATWGALLLGEHAAVSTNGERTESMNDIADTDAFPVVAATPALAFSEAQPIQVAANEGPAASRSRRVPLLVAAAAAALVAAIVGVGFATGSFGTSDSVAPPPITDAQTPPVTSAAIPTTSSPIPFPTTQAPVVPPPAAEPEDTVVPALPTPEPVLPPAPPPEQEPAPAPAPRTFQYPTVPPVPSFQYPTVPRFVP